MIWFFKRNIFDVKRMVAVVYNLEYFDASSPKNKLYEGGNFVAKRLETINEFYRDRILKAINRMDIKPTFDLLEISKRLEKGHYFIIVENEDEIVGWRWAAVGSVFFEEFNCHINLGQRDVFSYNTYVDKRYRGKKLNNIMDWERVRCLSEDGYKILWALIYNRNKAALRSAVNFGYKKMGYYYFIKLLFMSIHFPPKELYSYSNK